MADETNFVESVEEITLSEAHHYVDADFNEHGELILQVTASNIENIRETFRIASEGREYHDPSDRQPEDVGDVDDLLDDILGDEVRGSGGAD